MNTKESVEWFRKKNQRRKNEKNTMSRKELHELRKTRRNTFNGAHGRKETSEDVSNSITLD